MTVREYVGARYVPLFMGEWSNQNAYEPLSIVTNQGNSYTSRQAVPVGIDILNEQYWALTGNYNAQIEQYRQEVREVYGTISAFEDEINARTSDIVYFTGDTAAELNALIEAHKDDNKIVFANTVETADTIKIPLSSYVCINRIIYTGTDYAVDIVEGYNGLIKINKIVANSGGGVHVYFENEDADTGNTTHMGMAQIKIEYIVAKERAMFADPKFGWLDTWIYGTRWMSKNNECVYLGSTGGTLPYEPYFPGYVGQLNFRVNNFYSPAGYYAIHVGSEAGSVTMVDFGNTSTEGANGSNGVWYELPPATQTNSAYSQGVQGTFRTNENAMSYKFSGEVTKVRIPCNITDMQTSINKIDTSELTYTVQRTPIIPVAIINGQITNTQARRMKYTRAYVFTSVIFDRNDNPYHTRIENVNITDNNSESTAYVISDEYNAIVFKIDSSDASTEKYVRFPNNLIGDIFVGIRNESSHPLTLHTLVNDNLATTVGLDGSTYLYGMWLFNTFIPTATAENMKPNINRTLICREKK